MINLPTLVNNSTGNTFYVIGRIERVTVGLRVFPEAAKRTMAFRFRFQVDNGVPTIVHPSNYIYNLLPKIQYNSGGSYHLSAANGYGWPLLPNTTTQDAFYDAMVASPLLIEIRAVVSEALSRGMVPTLPPAELDEAILEMLRGAVREVYHPPLKGGGEVIPFPAAAKELSGSDAAEMLGLGGGDDAPAGTEPSPADHPCLGLVGAPAAKVTKSKAKGATTKTSPNLSKASKKVAVPNDTPSQE